ncbi:MAG: hypothetical protein QOE25_1060 [Actinomycetota bacterium]|jgi:uncharacterized OsmC-like protein|nr:hypothetical protein [Actinomycetota bacterium]
MIDIKALQRPLRDAYQADPAGAPLTLTVRSAPSDLGDPLHCAVTPDSTPDVVWRSGAHPAVGGVGDVPCSGDLLLGALAACQEVTLRMVAANQGVELLDVQVEVEGDWDPRGTLAMGREFPVGLTAIRCSTSVRVGEGVNEERAARLLKSAERYCVVLNTLRAGMDVQSEFSLTV